MSKFPLIGEVAQAGGLGPLFKLLETWDKAKLQQLNDEIAKASEEIDTVYQDLLFKPENFFNKSSASHLDAARLQVEGTLSEISSVVSYYLNS